MPNYDYEIKIENKSIIFWHLNAPKICILNTNFLWNWPQGNENWKKSQLELLSAAFLNLLFHTSRSLKLMLSTVKHFQSKLKNYHSIKVQKSWFQLWIFWHTALDTLCHMYLKKQFFAAWKHWFKSSKHCDYISTHKSKNKREIEGQELWFDRIVKMSFDNYKIF